MDKEHHDWFVAGVTFAVTFIAAVAVNVIIYAYGQGQMEHRVETLEKENAQLRVDWNNARDRIERALNREAK